MSSVGSSTQQLPSASAPERDCRERFHQEIVAALPKLGRLAYVLTRNAEDAADLLQATCLRALERASTLTNHDNIPGWLKCLMRNLHVDELRRPGQPSRQRLTPLDEIPEQPPEPLPLWRLVEDEDVNEVLPTLPSDLRATWDLHHRGDLDQKEIAARLQIARPTVATRIFRARAALKEAVIARYRIGRSRAK
jgi:RNA polymerase sigma-70 factor (ECF subfamily)